MTQMRLDLEQLWMRERMSVLFITHSIDEAILLADRVVVMTPRPGTIERVIDVGIPRRRGLDARSSARFVELEKEITSLFLSRGILRNS